VVRLEIVNVLTVPGKVVICVHGQFVMINVVAWVTV
jgi:hypothetical protein